MKQSRFGAVAATLVALAWVLGLAGCGGGGGGSSGTSSSTPTAVTPTAPVTPVPPTPPGPPPVAPAACGALPTLPAISISRTSGVAPLAVFFDATNVTAPGVARPFHELEYRWNFADPASGNWTTGSRGASRAEATGPIAAHVFETASATPYDVRLTVTDGTNIWCGLYSITVTDPEAEWATATLCVTTPGGSFAGCPHAATCTPATCIANANYQTVINTEANRGAAFKRILFECDRTFTSGGPAILSADGPGYLGSYPADCTAPAVGRLKPILRSTGTAFQLGENLPSPKLTFGDWRIVGLDVDGSAAAGTVGFFADGPAERITFLRNIIREFGTTIVAELGFLDAINMNRGLRVAPIWNQWAIVDNDLGSGNSQSGHLIAMSSSAFMGNLVQGLNAGHGFRLVHGKKVVFSNNSITGGPGGATLTIRGVDYSSQSRRDTAGTGGNQFTVPFNSPEAYTEQIIVSDNILTGGNPLNTQSVIPNSPPPGNDVRFFDIIVERNWIIPINAQSGMSWQAGSTTVRNNLFDFTSSVAFGSIAIGTGTNLAPTPSDLFVYNNSLYSTNNSGINCVAFISNSFTGVFAKNNLAYAPGNTAPCTGTSFGVAIVDSNNSSALQIRTQIPWAGIPTQPSEWAPANYALTGGASPGQPPANVPVFSDFFSTCLPNCDAPRVGTYMGAVNP